MLRRTKTIALTIVLATGCLIPPPPAIAESKTKEFLKYFNPVQKKTYLNQSQDREIKKRKFKAVDIKGAQPVDNKEVGLFAIIPYSKSRDLEYMKNVLAREDINGLSVILPWRLLNPKEDEFDWQALDQILELAKEQDKSVIVRVSTFGLDDSESGDSPSWVFSEEVRYLTYPGKDGNENVMPVFWDSGYLAKWSNFIQEMGERYDKNPLIHSVGITGGGLTGGTNVLPDFIDPSSLKIINPAAAQEQKEDTKSDDKKSEDSSEKSAENSKSEEKESSSDSSDISKGKSKEETADDDDRLSGKEAKASKKKLEKFMRDELGMNERQLVEHWKYVAELFPKFFEKTRLNLDINPPLPNKSGQSALDEISDYLVYRYGQRVYLTRQNISNAKHGFNEFRILLKFHPDTLSGYRINDGFPTKELDKLVKNAREDGISFCEIPADLLNNEEDEVKTARQELRQYLGYQLVWQKAEIPESAKSGEPIKASFTCINLGSATAMKPDRQLDKDIASSYKVQLELRNEENKPVVRSLHTPDIPTNEWGAGDSIEWQEDLKMPKLAPGKYSVYLAVVDTDNQRKLKFLNALDQESPKPDDNAKLGTIEITK